VLNSSGHHHRDMKTNTNTSKGRRFRTFMRHAWGDSVAAHRAMLRVPPYQDYLLNHRNEY
jgi:hypothetical protein